jgi:GT2 family glycosyltransferase
MMAVNPESRSSPRTAVVVPHFNRLDDTAACCRSLAGQNCAPAIIFVVDNASHAHTELELEAACPNATILRQDANRGFAGGVNVGIRAALSDPGIEFVWVLNNDTVCAPDTLCQLIAAAQAHARIGLVASPLLEGANGSHRRMVPAGKNLLWPWSVPVRTPSNRNPAYLSGASLLIRRETLEDIGLFDEGYFFFFEDADFSRRAVQNGWRLAIAREAKIEHRGSSTIRHMNELQARAYRAGHVRFVRKYSRQPLPCALPPFVLRLLADAFQLNWNAVAGNWRGWQEGWQTPISKP